MGGEAWPTNPPGDGLEAGGVTGELLGLGGDFFGEADGETCALEVGDVSMVGGGSDGGPAEGVEQIWLAMMQSALAGTAPPPAAGQAIAPSTASRGKIKRACVPALLNLIRRLISRLSQWLPAPPADEFYLKSITSRVGPER